MGEEERVAAYKNSKWDWKQCALTQYRTGGAEWDKERQRLDSMQKPTTTPLKWWTDTGAGRRPGAEPQTHRSWYRHSSSCRTGRRRERAPPKDRPPRRTWRKSSRPSASPCGNSAPHWPDSPSETEAERCVGQGRTRSRCCGGANGTRIGYLESEKKLDGVGERRRGKKIIRFDQSEEKEVEKRPGEAQRRGEPGRQRHKAQLLWGVELIYLFILYNCLSYEFSCN